MKVKASHSCSSVQNIIIDLFRPLVTLFPIDRPYHYFMKKEKPAHIRWTGWGYLSPGSALPPSVLAKVSGEKSRKWRKPEIKRRVTLGVNITPFLSSLPAPSRHLLTPVFQETKPWVSQVQISWCQFRQQLGSQLPSDPGHLSTAPKCCPCPVLGLKAGADVWAWDFKACLWELLWG